MRLLTTFSILLELCPFAIHSQSWQQLANFNRSANSLYSDSSSNLLYVGGSFKWSVTDTLNGICSWDGQQLNKMKEGLYDACGFNVCHASPLILGYQGNLYAGSSFKEINSMYANGITKWDGQN